MIAQGGAQSPSPPNAHRDATGFSRPSARAKSRGRYVGLSLVRELVERRGGWVEVDDAEDARGGAVFTAWLPDAVSAETAVSS